MTMKKIYTLYQTNNPNTLGGYMTYSTLSEALDTIGQIGFNGMLIDTITAVTMVDSEWWHGHRTGHVSEILSQGVIYKLSEKKSKHTSQMRKENKILVTDIGEIDEVKVIFDDDNKPYLYSYNGEDEFYRPDETYKFFDNKEQAEEYVRENMAPFDRNKVKEYLTKRYKDSGISDIKDILPDSLIKEYSNHSLHITDLGWIQCALLKNALKGYTRLNAKGFESIKSGGILFTFSCSQIVTKDQFRNAVFTAAAQSGRKVRILHQLHQPADHPINIYHPEGEYLKGLVLYVED